MNRQLFAAVAAAFGIVCSLSVSPAAAKTHVFACEPEWAALAEAISMSATAATLAGQRRRGEDPGDRPQAGAVPGRGAGVLAGARGRPLAALVLSDEERSFLEAQVRRHRVARSMSDRCRMILRSADGLGNKAVAAEIGAHEHTVGKWRRRFVKDRIDGLSDEPRPGRPRSIEDETVAQVVERTLTSRPADATHWSLRSMAKEAGLSHTSIWRIWGAFGLQPHRAETFKLSVDPHFVKKVRDIVGPTCRRRIARWCSVSTKRARFRPSTAPSRSRMSWASLRNGRSPRSTTWRGTR